MSSFVIDLTQSFETLPKAPIVEAIIHLRTLATVQPNEESVKELVASKFPEYKFLDSQRQLQLQFQVQPYALPNQTSQDLGWMGCRFQSSDQKYVALFNRDGFVLSRLEPYQNWQFFLAEAKRLWIEYAKFVVPQQLNRIGLRYINRIKLPVGDLNFEQYMHVSPSSPEGMNFSVPSFMHMDSLVEPNRRYGINVIKTIQAPNPSENVGPALILDIDVGTLAPTEYRPEKTEESLTEMCWLKNKIFFGSVTSKSLEMFR